MKRLNVTLTREVALQLRMIWLLLFCAPVCLHAQGDDYTNPGRHVSSYQCTRYYELGWLAEWAASDDFPPAGQDADANVTVVRTAAQLQAAVVAGAQDIEVQQHIDLSDLNLPNDESGWSAAVLGIVKPSTRSIRGNCTSFPGSSVVVGLSLQDLQEHWDLPKCLIISRTDFFIVIAPIWIDSLYLRRRPAAYYPFTFIYSTGAAAALYATNVTVQDNGPNNSTVIWSGESSQAVFADCTFDNVGGDISTVVADSASVVLKHVVLSNIVQRRRVLEDDNAEYCNPGVLVSALPSASISSEDVSFRDVSVVNFLVSHDDGGMLGGDLTFINVTAEGLAWDRGENHTVGSDGGGGGALVKAFGRQAESSQIKLSPLKLRLSNNQVPRLSMDDPWLTRVRQVLAAATSGQISFASNPLPGSLPLQSLGVAGSASPLVAAVYTAQEFQEAFTEGIRDIEIHAHLDLQNLPIPIAQRITGVEGEFTFQVGFVSPTTRSIRGKCGTPPGAEIMSAVADLNIENAEAWRSPRCFVLGFAGIFIIDRSQLWIDALHIQIVANHPTVYAAVNTEYHGHLYMTDTVIQGKPSESYRSAISASRGPGGIYAEDCVFNDLGSNDYAVVDIEGSVAFFNSCEFRDIYAFPRKNQSSVTFGSDAIQPFFVDLPNSTLALSNCTLKMISSTAHVWIMHDAQVYSNDADLQILEDITVQKIRVKPLSAMPTRSLGSPPPPRTYDRWFADAREALRAPQASAYISAFPLRGASPSTIPTNSTSAPNTTSAPLSPVPQPRMPQPAEVADPPAPTAALAGQSNLSPTQIQDSPADAGPIPADPPLSVQSRPQPANPGFGTLTSPEGFNGDVSTDASDGASALSIPLIVGASGALAVVLLLCAAAAWLTVAKRKRRESQQHPDARKAQASPQVKIWNKGQPDQLHASATQHRPGSAYGFPGARQTLPLEGTSVSALTANTQTTWADFQQAGGAARTALEELEVALDAMCIMQAPFHHRYQVFSGVHRRVGGQGVVQFAGIAGRHDRVAMKFYLDQSAFERERELYTESQLKEMMPATLAIEDNKSGQAATAYGYIFPPFVIIECGQSLDEWSMDNANKDFITIFQALSHAVRALKKLHSFGYAHRDIKPGNILRRHKQHDWTLIDFGCTAEIGSVASLKYSLKYAAPEVVYALEAGDTTIIVDAAVDIWAIGVVAFELLTGERAFPNCGLSFADSNQAARDAISGRMLLPWERSDDITMAQLEKLRVLRPTVLQCLARDPTQRPTADSLVGLWDRTFDLMQTQPYTLRT